MNYKLDNNDILGLQNFLGACYFKYGEISVKKIQAEVEFCIDSYEGKLENFGILYQSEHKNLSRVYDYFNEKHKINAFSYCESHLIHKSKNSKLLDFYRVSLDAKKYTTTDEKRKELIDSFIFINRSDFDNLIKIALKCERIESQIKNFFTVLNKTKRFKFTALDEERIEKIFNRKFPHTNDFNKESLQQSLPTLKKSDYLQQESGFYYQMKIDCDILSKTNKINADNNSQAITVFFKLFNTYIQKNEQIGLKFIEVSSDNLFLNRKILRFHFENDNNFENKKVIIGNLLNYCLEHDGKTLKGSSLEKDNTSFFNSFLMHESMKKNLDNKPTKSPKIKI